MDERLATSTPKPSSPRKMFPIPATSTLSHHEATGGPGNGSNSSGWKYR